MVSPDEIAARLPPPRDDEPVSLRQDISDELADHLACALDRERQRQSALPETVESPAERVLKRFGNPAQIALRLWRDAMWGKIMTQRILVAFSGLMAAACCVTVFFAVRLVRHQERALAIQQEAFEEALKENREASEKLLEKTQADAAALQGQLVSGLAGLESKLNQPSDWNPVTIQLVQGTADGPPAAGFHLRLTMRSGDVPSVSGTSDENGKVVFPRVRYGHYQMQVTAPWEEGCAIRLEVNPGESLERKIVCPPQAPKRLTGRLQLDLPPDLAERPLWFRFDVLTMSRRFGERDWSTRNAVKFGPKTSGETLFSARGAIYEDSRFHSEALDYGPDKTLRGVDIPGEDYRGSAIQFFTLYDLEREEGSRTPQRLTQIPDALIESPDVKLTAREGAIHISVPDNVVQSLRKGFEAIDDMRKAGSRYAAFFAENGAQVTTPTLPAMLK